MNLLDKSVQTITFDDVVDFCKQKVTEGVRLDYKRTKPTDLSKHFAAFSNTLGGLIIIGVDEDKKTGAPKAWAGIDPNAQDIEWVHQMASSVVPLPSYEIAATNEDGGKVFLLVRIFEGPAAPYVTRSDPTVWIRTGNVSTPLSAANREDLLQLVGKSSNAELNRSTAHSITLKHFEGMRQMADKMRQRAADPGRQSAKPRKEALLHVAIMPHNPVRQLFNPRTDTKPIHDFMGPEFNYFGVLAGTFQSLPNGLGAVFHNSQGVVKALQIYDDGVLSYRADVLVDKDNRFELYTSHLFEPLVRLLKLGRHIYSRVGYQGEIRGTITLSDCKNSQVWSLTASDPFQEAGTTMLAHYSWRVGLSTFSLNDKQELEAYLVELAHDIQWDLGAQDYGDDAIKKWLVDRCQLR